MIAEMRKSLEDCREYNFDKPFPATMATKTENTGIPFEDAGIFLSGGS